VSPSITYIALDGERLDFPVKKTVNRHLVASAVKRIHQGQDADRAVRGLTSAEYALVLQIIEKLQNHRVPETA
jgi:hypothetical protein